MAIGAGREGFTGDGEVLPQEGEKLGACQGNGPFSAVIFSTDALHYRRNHLEILEID
jgi:hypothetical protein